MKLFTFSIFKIKTNTDWANCENVCEQHHLIKSWTFCYLQYVKILVFYPALSKLKTRDSRNVSKTLVKREQPPAHITTENKTCKHKIIIGKKSFGINESQYYDYYIQEIHFCSHIWADLFWGREGERGVSRTFYFGFLWNLTQFFSFQNSKIKFLILLVQMKSILLTF